MPKAPALQSRILYTRHIQWQKLSYIQNDNFKDLPATAMQKLKASIIDNQFSQPFYVWQNGKELFCLDGRHRSLAMQELKSEGINIPDELPATFLNCKDKKEAAKFVLMYSSVYAKITETGLLDFAKLYDLDFKELDNVISLPEFGEIHLPSMNSQGPSCANYDLKAWEYCLKYKTGEKVLFWNVL